MRLLTDNVRGENFQIVFWLFPIGEYFGYSRKLQHVNYGLKLGHSFLENFNEKIIYIVTAHIK